MKTPRALPAPLPTERKEAHALAVHVRETLGYTTRELHGYNVPRTSADWLKIAARAHEAVTYANELDALARRAARMLAIEENCQ